MNAWLEKAEHFLHLAQRLLDEEEIETAVSRIYYAAFYAAQELLEAKGLRYSSHSALIAAYGREFAKTGILDPQFHRTLRETFSARQAAEYTLVQPLSKVEARRLLDEVWAFLQAARAHLESLAGEP